MVSTFWTASNFISRLSLQELFNAASAIITDLAIVSTAITISYKSAKHILASITTTKLHQLIDIHIGYFPLNFLEISHRINLSFPRPKDSLNFYDWAIKNGYNDSLTIDRINPDAGYEPANCRWVTMETQANNSRSNVDIEIGGISHTVAEWSKKTGARYNDIYHQFRAGKNFQRQATPHKL